MSWMAYLGLCVVLGTLTDHSQPAEARLTGDLLDGREALTDLLKRVLDGPREPAPAGGHAR
jgi:hypothetical protein